MGAKQKYFNSILMENCTYNKNVGKKGLLLFFLLSGSLSLVFLCSFVFNTSSASAYSVSMSTNNSIELDAVVDNDGVTIKDESINVISDCRSGYNLSIATPEGSDLYKYDNNTPAATASFTAVDGTSHHDSVKLLREH